MRRLETMTRRGSSGCMYIDPKVLQLCNSTVFLQRPLPQSPSLLVLFWIPANCGRAITHWPAAVYAVLQASPAFATAEYLGNHHDNE